MEKREREREREREEEVVVVRKKKRKGNDYFSLFPLLSFLFCFSLVVAVLLKASILGEEGLLRPHSQFLSRKEE